MTVELIAQVKKLFPRNKIYLFSMSWGSILSAKVLGRDGHIVDGVVAWGQIVRDFKAMMVNGYRKNKSLWNEILTLDLSKALCEVSVPYIILQGDTDIVTSTKNVDELVRNAKNVNLTCEIVKDSGHMPGVLGMEHALRQLCRLAEVG